MLKHYNDGKEKWQSHEVYDDAFSDICTGYGETYEEAFDEFKKNAAEYKQNLEMYYNNIDKEEVVEVDCVGKPTK